MEASKLCIFFLLLVMNQSAAPMSTRSNIPPPTYQTLVQTVKGGIFPYCQELKSGADKYACRLASFPEIGFLFCKKATIAGDKCEDVLKTELGGLQILHNAGISTVKYSWLISDVICPDSKTVDGTCSGFFENWVDETAGRFFHVRVYIDDNTLDEETTKMIDKTKKEGLTITRKDLLGIETFMETEKPHYYRCICDLQGFFLFDGGFLVSDTEGIELLGGQIRCKHGGPTPETFLLGVRFMMKKIDEAINGHEPMTTMKP